MEPIFLSETELLVRANAASEKEWEHLAKVPCPAHLAKNEREGA